MSGDQIKPGYKRTEVGVIPEQWVAMCLGGMTFNSSPITYGVLKPGDYVPDGVPLLQIRDVIHGEIREDRLHRISKQLSEQYSRTILAGNEVVVSLVGTIGRVGYIDAALAGGNLHRNLARIHVSDSHSSRFVYYTLCSDPIQNAIRLGAFGSTQALLNLTDLRLLLIATPKKEEQVAIATALSDVDALLTKLDQLIAKKRDLKLATMQQLLTGQTRLPGFSGAWEVKRLGEIAEVSKGEQLHCDETCTEGNFPHYNGGVSPSSYTHKPNAPANSIAISEGGNSCGFVQFIDQPFWCGGHCYFIMPKNIDKRFLYQALKGKQKSIMELRVGSGLPNVQKTALLAFAFESPIQRDEQTAIATVLADMDAELANLEVRRDKTLSFKQGMMQELLSGKTRLN